MTLLITKFCPSAPLSYTRIDCLLDNSCADTASSFNLFPIVVEAIGYDSFSAVFVSCDLLGGKGGWVLEIFIIGPVRTTMACLARYLESWEGRMIAFITLQVWTYSRIIWGGQVKT